MKDLKWNIIITSAFVFIQSNSNKVLIIISLPSHIWGIFLHHMYICMTYKLFQKNIVFYFNPIKVGPSDRTSTIIKQIGSKYLTLNIIFLPIYFIDLKSSMGIFRKSKKYQHSIMTLTSKGV